ncbi:hypothetical protein [Photobacterium sanguinicancri]|uniref:hypothetical protein n=1 Tax=Photobacterium sanguinicancri TaxID=875932 RepID=UPI0026E2EB1E|nr:hypothetical protein [Photobacterium sanguinicancri]MDO6500460.1 hypothetical protein [Photobacterium sanguinicancri]
MKYVLPAAAIALIGCSSTPMTYTPPDTNAVSPNANPACKQELRRNMEKSCIVHNTKCR